MAEVRQKKYIYQIYDFNGIHIHNVHADFDSFEKTLNGSIGNVTIQLIGSIDDVDLTVIEVGYEFRIYVIDNDILKKGYDFDSPLLIYKGIISSINIDIRGGSQKVSFDCVGIIALLARDIFKDGTTTTISKSGVSPGTIIREIIDQYSNETSIYLIFSYSEDSIDISGANVAYSFEQKTYKEAIDATKKLGSASRNYYIYPSGEVQYLPKPSSAQHSFIMNKHFARLTFKRDWNTIRNILLFWDGQVAGTYKQFIDDASAGTYRRLIERITDSRLTNTDAIDEFGNSFIDSKKNPSYNLSIEIFDNNFNEFGYDIESIEPGQTCRLYNVPKYIENLLGSNMLIKKVNYKKRSAIIEIEPEFDDDFINRMISMKRRITELENVGIPNDYTT